MWQTEVTPGLPLLSCLPREAINKEIMAKQFTQRLRVSLMPFKCANHFFHYSMGGGGGGGGGRGAGGGGGERGRERVTREKVTNKNKDEDPDGGRQRTCTDCRVPWCIYGDDIHT